MCKFCETDTWNHLYNIWVGEVICDTIYEDCKIVRKDDDYRIRLSGSYEDYSEPISYCPFCGRKLKE